MEVDVGRPAAAFEHELASKDMILAHPRRTDEEHVCHGAFRNEFQKRESMVETVEYALLARSKNGREMWTEVKGLETRDWQILWKLFDALYPERDNRVIK
jgi:hypothetical protein